MSDLIVPNLSGFEWLDVRKAIKRVIQAASPDSTVHSEWVLEFDPQTAVGKSTAGLNGKNGHSGFVHSHVFGLAGEQENGSEGGTFATIGGGTCDYDLSFAFWSLYDFKSWRVKFGTSQAIEDDSPEKNATAFAESEARNLKAYFRMNPTLGLDSGRVRYVYPIVIESSDNHPFSNGKRIIIVQRTIRVRIRESFA